MIIKHFQEKLNKSLTLFLAILLLLNSSVWLSYFSFKQEFGEFNFHVLDVGQGDSILVKTPNNHYGLIDTGKGNYILSELNNALPYNYRKLDFVILTHADADHIEGILEVINRYEIERIFMNKTNKENALLKEIYNLIGTKYLNLYELNDFALDGVKFNVIWPDLPGPAILETNDSSISLIISYKKLDILTLGDLSNNYEIKAVEDINHIDIDVLKVSHHGSKSSTTKKFLDITKPELSIISVGLNNSYGHPAEEVIYNLNEVGSEIYRTDLSGRVKISSDGFRIKIETEEESSVKIINLE